MSHVAVACRMSYVVCRIHLEDVCMHGTYSVDGVAVALRRLPITESTWAQNSLFFLFLLFSGGFLEDKPLAEGLLSTLLPARSAPLTCARTRTTRPSTLEPSLVVDCPHWHPSYPHYATRTLASSSSSSHPHPHTRLPPPRCPSH